MDAGFCGSYAALKATDRFTQGAELPNSAAEGEDVMKTVFLNSMRMAQRRDKRHRTAPPLARHGCATFRLVAHRRPRTGQMATELSGSAAAVLQ